MNTLAESPTYYPIMCPWCLQKGKITRTGWSEAQGTSGICPDCLAKLRRDAGLEEKDV